MTGPFFCYTSAMDIYQLAEIMHNRLCHYDHTEYCAWYYRVDDPDRWEQNYSAHQRYLTKARYVHDITGLEIEDIARVVKAL